VKEPWPLPSDWHWSPFREVARVASDLVDPGDFPDAAHIAPNHIESGTGRLLSFRTISEDQVTSVKHRFRRGQLLYSKIRPYLAKVAIPEIDGLCSADMYPIESELDPRYLKWWMLTREFTRLAAGEQARTVLPKINRRALEQLPVPVAPARQQQLIVEVLENHLSRLDAAERNLEGARKRLEVFGLAQLSQARSNLAGTGMYRIGEVADTSLGKMLDAKKQVGSPTPYLRNLNVRWGTFDLSDLQTTPLTNADRLRLELRDGDVLVCEGGEPGRNAVWRHNDTGIAYQKALHRLRVRDSASVLPEYLSLMLTEAIRSGRCDGMFTGTTIKHLPQEKLRAIEIPLPDAEAQHRLVDEHAALGESVARMAAEVQRGVLQLSQLRRSLLTSAFSGRMTAPLNRNISAAEEGLA
jgi:type I restriction enzyme S subunit